MIVVRVEMWPGGNASKARELMRMHVTNDGSGTSKRGNYHVELFRKKGVHVLRSGTVTDYPRGIYHVGRLILRALKACFPEERKHDREETKDA